MKFLLSAIVVITLISCANSTAGIETSSQQPPDKTTNPSNEAQQESIVGEWEQQYTCYDKNGNYKLEAEEKIPSNVHVGFDWFRFNADGTCLKDKEVKFKGTYSIEEKNRAKKLLMEGGNKVQYSIIELTDTELILGAEGAFIVFKRIK